MHCYPIDSSLPRELSVNVLLILRVDFYFKLKLCYSVATFKYHYITLAFIITVKLYEGHLLSLAGHPALILQPISSSSQHFYHLLLNLLYTACLLRYLGSKGNT